MSRLDVFNWKNWISCNTFTDVIPNRNLLTFDLEIVCPALSDLQNGKVECTGGSYGENCTRSCNYGYGLTFDPVVTTCIGDGLSTLGSWYSINDTDPTCESKSLKIF